MDVLYVNSVLPRWQEVNKKLVRVRLKLGAKQRSTA
jgi:hypothetical protein